MCHGRSSGHRSHRNAACRMWDTQIQNLPVPLTKTAVLEAGGRRSPDRQCLGNRSCCLCCPESRCPFIEQGIVVVVVGPRWLSIAPLMTTGLAWKKLNCSVRVSPARRLHSGWPPLAACTDKDLSFCYSRLAGLLNLLLDCMLQPDILDCDSFCFQICC